MIFDAPDIPRALAASAMTIFTGAAALIAQATPLDNPSSYLEYGFAGLVGLSFILMVWAVVNNKIVSQDTNSIISEGSKREEKILRLIEEAGKREQQLLTQNDRLLDMLNAKSS